MTIRKPWLSPSQQTAQLKQRGVRFDTFSEEGAIEYLTKNSNYFRIRSYRTGFAKVEEGKGAGQYANLDFAMLVNLSIVDMLLRYEMLPLTLDIEHFSKVELLQEIEAHKEDGHGIVADFLATYDHKMPDGTITNATIAEIDRGRSSPYASGILSKYPNHDFPVWAFVEVISFGTFSYFYKFCAQRFGSKAMNNRFYMLRSVRGLRNACAHNSCILNDMSSGKPLYRVSNDVTHALGKIEGLKQNQRRSKMDNDRFQQIATTLYLHSKCASAGVISHRAARLDEFVQHMNKHASWYNKNTQVLSDFEFLTKVIKAWFPTPPADEALTNR